jgi:hypothetical protein
MKFVETTKPYRKSGEAPPLFFALVELSALAPFWESIGNQSLLSQVRWANLGHPSPTNAHQGLNVASRRPSISSGLALKQVARPYMGDSPEANKSRLWWRRALRSSRRADHPAVHPEQ